MLASFRVCLLLNELLKTSDMLGYALENIYRKPAPYVYLHMSPEGHSV